MIGTRLFTSEQEVHGLAGFALCAVAEHDHVKQLIMDEASLLENGRDGGRSLRRTRSTSRVLRTAPSSTVATQEATALPPTTAQAAPPIERRRRSHQPFAHLRHARSMRSKIPGFMPTARRPARPIILGLKNR
jgi:hypothetical protein